MSEDLWASKGVPTEGVVVSYFIARRFGDVAGTNAAIAYDKKKDTQQALASVQALLGVWSFIAYHFRQLPPVFPSDIAHQAPHILGAVRDG